MGRRRRGRISRPLRVFSCAVLTAAVLASAAAAQSVQGWRLYRSPHFFVYTVDGTAGARDVEQVTAVLERIYAQVIAPLKLPPSRLIYPLYPSVDRFRADWWYFSTLGYGDLIHAWGAVYAGDLRSLTPYTLTRAVVGDAFPRAIPLLRWGLGEALGDRAVGVDAHAHLKTVLAPGQNPPALDTILAPSDFGAQLPLSYPGAVSFVAFLLERYGLPSTAAFLDRVTYRYYDFTELFAGHFGEPLDRVEEAWRRRVGSAQPLRRVDIEAYLAATRFVYRATLAGNPGRVMLQPEGPVVVSEALRAVEPLRRLDLDAVRVHMETARRASERAQRQGRRTEFGLRAILYLLVLAPIALAVGWLLWPLFRGRLAPIRR